MLIQYSSTPVVGLMLVWLTMISGPPLTRKATCLMPLMWKATTPTPMLSVKVWKGTTSQRAMALASVSTSSPSSSWMPPMGMTSTAVARTVTTWPVRYSNSGVETAVVPLASTMAMISYSPLAMLMGSVDQTRMSLYAPAPV